MPDGPLMDERRDRLVKGRMAAQAAAAQNRGDDWCFQYFGASVATQVIPGQLRIA